MVTTRPMNHGTALSLSATHSSATNKAANSHFAWRAKCHRNAIKPGGGSGVCGALVGVRNCSKKANIGGGVQASLLWRQSRGGNTTARLMWVLRRGHDSTADLYAEAPPCHRDGGKARKENAKRKRYGDRNEILHTIAYRLCARRA